MSVVEKQNENRVSLSHRQSSPHGLKFKYNIQGMNDTGNITEYGKQDVDEEVCVAAALEEDTKGRKNDGEDDFDKVASGERHDCCSCSACIRFFRFIVECSSGSTFVSGTTLVAEINRELRS